MSTRNAAGGSAYPGVAIRARELTLETSECLDYCRGFKRPVPFSDAYLLENLPVHEPLDCVVRLRETSFYQTSRAANGDDWRANERMQKQVGSGICADPAEAFAPLCLNLLSSALE